jgi:uncharacterized delta-60 repeat protein
MGMFKAFRWTGLGCIAGFVFTTCMSAVGDDGGPGSLDSSFAPVHYLSPPFLLSENQDLIIRVQVEASDGIGFISPAGTPKAAWASSNGMFVATLAQQADSKILVGFGSDSAHEERVWRLLPDGTPDPVFHRAKFIYWGDFPRINALHVCANGTILTSGDFTNVDGHTTYYLARLDSNGAVDTTFQNFNPGKPVAIGEDHEGRILVATSQFTNYTILRLQSDGSLDSTFPRLTNATEFLILRDGNYLISGAFTNISGVSRAGVTVVHQDGSVEPGFDPGSHLDGQVYALAQQEDGRIFLGGRFKHFDATSVPSGLVRLFPNGQLDPSWHSSDSLHAEGTDWGPLQVLPAPAGVYLLGEYGGPSELLRLRGDDVFRMIIGNSPSLIEKITVGSTTGDQYTLESSTNLLQWDETANAIADAFLLTFEMPKPTDKLPHFYRAIRKKP